MRDVCDGYVGVRQYYYFRRRHSEFPHRRPVARELTESCLLLHGRTAKPAPNPRSLAIPFVGAESALLPPLERIADRDRGPGPVADRTEGASRKSSMGCSWNVGRCGGDDVLADTGNNFRGAQP